MIISWSLLLSRVPHSIFHFRYNKLELFYVKISYKATFFDK